MKYLLFLLCFNFAVRAQSPENPDIVLIGAGIVSATLATLLHELDPSLKIEIFEGLDEVACESSGTFNNAGSGHAALCELNYTPLRPNGEIDVKKAVEINQDFELSKEFWAYLVEKRGLRPQSFIHAVPHISWVRGEENVAFLKKRYETLKQIPLFRDMEYTEDPEILLKWMPLMMRGRAEGERMAATRSTSGTDVDFGHISQLMLQNLVETSAVKLFVSHNVKRLSSLRSGGWKITVKESVQDKIKEVRSRYVFIGAGGGTLPLLKSSGIPESKGYGGFPVGGKFLLYRGKDLANENFGKVYGQAAVGAPPMSVPHLDTRIINGEKRLIFGPFAGATMKFLKTGSNMDLLSSISTDNAFAMLEAGFENSSLVSYLMKQEMLTHEGRVEYLREFVPTAKADEWITVEAGNRVQILKHEPNGGNVLHFGTEVVSSKDGSLTAMLGASPGASTSVAIMLEVLRRAFPDQMASEPWKTKLAEMVPSFGKHYKTDEASMLEKRAVTIQTLRLNLECEPILASD